MKYAWLVISIFAARFFATAIAAAPIDGDLSWQRHLGDVILRYHHIPRDLGNETFTAPFHAWVAQEWLFSVIAAGARTGAAWWLFAGACAAAASAALALGAYHAQRRGASPRAIAVCTAFAGVALFASFGVRAQVIAWPLAVLVLALLDVDGPWAFAALPVVALWSNLHASVLLAPVAAVALSLGTWLDERRLTVRVRRGLLLTAGCTLAVCCNPFGVELPRYGLGLMTGAFKAHITEWQPTSPADPSFAYGALPLLVIAVFFLAGNYSRRWRELCLFVPFVYLLLSAARNIALFGIVALPVAACALTRNVAWFAAPAAAQRRLQPRFERFALPAFSAALAGLVALALVRASTRAGDELGTRAFAALVATPGEHRLLCADFAWCGQAVGVPRVRVFLDGRADPYPQRVWDDFVAIGGLHARWRSALEANGVNAVLTRVDTPLDRALARTTGWQSAYRDRAFRLWLADPTHGSPVRAQHDRVDRGLETRAVPVCGDQRYVARLRRCGENDALRIGRDVTVGERRSIGD